MIGLWDVVVRPAVADDADALGLLHIDVWEDAYSDLMPVGVFQERRASIPELIARWRRQLAHPLARTTVAEYAGGLVGFISVGPPQADDVDVDEELYALYVRAPWWGSGLGAALLTSALAQRPAYLWVLGGNDRAIAFYGKHGFVEDGVTRAGQYGTELRMTRGPAAVSPATTGAANGTLNPKSAHVEN